MSDIEKLVKRIATLEGKGKMTEKQYTDLLELLNKEFGKINDRLDRVEKHLRISKN